MSKRFPLTLKYFIVWIIIQLLFNWISYIFMPPFGMHQGAQSDRACIALNYFQISENFFLPRVMETRGFDGVTGLEFPIIQYLVSWLYKIFGYHTVFYRLFIGAFSFLGFFATMKISGFFIQREFSKYLLSILWLSSPLLEFYGFGFLADIPAMSLALMGIYHFLKYYYGINKNTHWWYFILFFCLAGLLKVTFLVYFVACISIIVLSHFNQIKLEIPFKMESKFFWGILSLALPIVAWYSYSNYLTKLTWNSHFLQHSNMPKSFQDFISNTSFAINTWTDSIYPKKFLGFVILILFFTLLKSRKNLDVLGYFILISFMGLMAIFLLFNGQYRFHDYYLILFFPFFYFIFLYIQQTYINGQFVFNGFIPIVVILGFYISPITNFAHAKNQLRRTFTAGDYYCQGVYSNLHDFNETKQWLNSQDNSKNNELIWAFDITPNTALFLLERQGIRIAPDFNANLTFSIIHDKLKTEKKLFPYIIINDKIKWDLLKVPHIQLSEKPIFQSGSIQVFKILNIKSLITNE